MPNTYFFLLGRTPELSRKELEAVISPEASHFLPIISRVNLESDDQAVKIFERLGGSVKVMRLDGQFTDLTQEQLQQYATAYLAENSRPTFAIAEFNRDKQPRLDVPAIKIALKERNISSRFIEGPREGLSASILLHHKNVIELNIVQEANIVYFARTLSTQNIDDWTVRDRQKPYADRKKGMLPPKVARMMVNLALGSLTNTVAEQSPIIYDPFCGSGTVLLEAAMLGCQVVASDLDRNSVDGTQANLEWFKKTYNRPELNEKVFQAEVANAKVEQLGQKVEAIVTEPFLGKPTPDPAQLSNIFKGLEKMYLGAFKNWTKILKKKSVVVIVFPYVQAAKKAFSLEGMIDKLQQLGYTPLSEPVSYYRPQAVVQRQIWIFRFNN